MAKKKKKRKPETGFRPLLPTWQSELRALPSVKLRSLVVQWTEELQIAQDELQRRQLLATELERMTVGQLERLVIGKRPHWRFAQYILDRKRASGASNGDKPPSLPVTKCVVPHDPEGTEGDYWRNHSG